MMPIHGRFVPYTEFVEAAIRMRSMTSMTPTTNWIRRCILRAWI